MKEFPSPVLYQASFRVRLSLVKKILLALILLSGAFYRFAYLNWDEGHWFHPDERNVAMAVGKLHFFDQLNPQFFAYNGLWFYLTRAVAEAVSAVTAQPAWLGDWQAINLITRFLSALFSTLSLVLVFIVTRKLINTKAALLAAALSAYTVGYLQYAHYGVTESLLIFWVLLIIQLSLTHQWVWLSLVCGLAVATKTSALAFLLIPGITWLLEMFHKERRASLLRLTPFLILVFAATCFLFSPYSLLSWAKFKESMTYESGVVSGRLAVPYTVQFTHAKDYLFSLSNLPWHLGPLLALFGVAGVIGWLAHQVVKRKLSAFFPALVFTVLYFGYVGAWYTKFIRYLLPIYPILIIAAVWLLFGIHRRFRQAGFLIISLVLISSLLWSTAYLTVFERESTRLTASRWIYANIPAGSSLLTEHWDDGLPTSLPGFDNNYIQVELANYEPDTPAKLDLLSQTLADGNFVILSSRRLSGSIGKNPDRYPLTSFYYQALFAEKLGYRLVQRFTSYPSLGPIVINDDRVEETFQIYDHPVVLIFQNQSKLSAAAIKAILESKRLD